MKKQFTKKDLVLLLNKIVVNFLSENNLINSEISTNESKFDIGINFRIIGQIIVLKGTIFNKDFWFSIQNGNALWSQIIELFKGNNIKTIGIEIGNIQGELRQPNIQIIYGNDPWAQIKEDGIIFTWNVTKNMFCRGNINEKKRLIKDTKEHEIVLDMYAGIGYFTLPYLVNANVKKLIAIEKNPDSIEALHKNLKLNKVSERCCVILGDNREVTPKNVADRINMGYFNISLESYKSAVGALRNGQGVIHVHSLAPIRISDTSYNEVAESIKSVLWNEHTKLYGELYEISQNVTKVKTYSPFQDHIVVDINFYGKLMNRDQSILV